MYIILSLTCLWVPLCQSGASDWGWTAGHRTEEMTAWQRSGRPAPLHSLDPLSVPLWDLCRHIHAHPIHIARIVDYSIPSPANASVPKLYGNPMLTYIQIFLQPVVDVHVTQHLFLHLVDQWRISAWSMCLTSQENVNLRQDQKMSLKGQIGTGSVGSGDTSGKHTDTDHIFNHF